MPFCRVVYEGESDRVPSARPAALKGWPERTVRMIYFLPKDRPFRPEVVDQMKDAILQIQAFFAQQMQAHGHGDLTFRIETDDQGEPLVHRVDGEHTDEEYAERGGAVSEASQAFAGGRDIELVVIDQSSETIPSRAGEAGGLALTREVNGQTFGMAVVPASFSWWPAAHELGHVFGLDHDFRDDANIMSYGYQASARLSACNARLLTVHPYFNPGIGVAQSSPETVIDLTSPVGYPPGSSSVPVRLAISGSTGLHQVLLFAVTRPPHLASGNLEVKACRTLSGETAAVVAFATTAAFRPAVRQISQILSFTGLASWQSISTAGGPSRASDCINSLPSISQLLGNLGG